MKVRIPVEMKLEVWVSFSYHFIIPVTDELF